MEFKQDFDPESLSSLPVTSGYRFGGNISDLTSVPITQKSSDKPLVIVGGCFKRNATSGGHSQPMASYSCPPASSSPFCDDKSHLYQPVRPFCPPRPLSKHTSKYSVSVTPSSVTSHPSPVGFPSVSPDPVASNTAFSSKTPGTLTKNQKARKAKKLYLAKQRLEAESSGRVSGAVVRHLQKKQDKTMRRACKFFRQGLQIAAEVTQLEDSLVDNKSCLTPSSAHQTAQNLLSRAESIATHALRYNTINRSFDPYFVTQSETPIEYLHKVAFKQ